MAAAQRDGALTRGSRLTSLAFDELPRTTFTNQHAYQGESISGRNTDVNNNDNNNNNNNNNTLSANSGRRARISPAVDIRSDGVEVQGAHQSLYSAGSSGSRFNVKRGPYRATSANYSTLQSSNVTANNTSSGGDAATTTESHIHSASPAGLTTSERVSTIFMDSVDDSDIEIEEGKEKDEGVATRRSHMEMPYSRAGIVSTSSLGGSAHADRKGSSQLTGRHPRYVSVAETHTTSGVGKDGNIDDDDNDDDDDEDDVAERVLHSLQSKDRIIASLTQSVEQHARDASSTRDALAAAEAHIDALRTQLDDTAAELARVTSFFRAQRAERAVATHEGKYDNRRDGGGDDDDDDRARAAEEVVKAFEKQSRKKEDELALARNELAHAQQQWELHAQKAQLLEKQTREQTTRERRMQDELQAAQSGTKHDSAMLRAHIQQLQEDLQGKNNELRAKEKSHSKELAVLRGELTGLTAQFDAYEGQVASHRALASELEIVKQREQDVRAECERLSRHLQTECTSTREDAAQQRRLCAETLAQLRVCQQEREMLQEALDAAKSACIAATQRCMALESTVADLQNEMQHATRASDNVSLQLQQALNRQKIDEERIASLCAAVEAAMATTNEKEQEIQKLQTEHALQVARLLTQEDERQEGIRARVEGCVEATECAERAIAKAEKRRKEAEAAVVAALAERDEYRAKLHEAGVLARKEALEYQDLATEMTAFHREKLEEVQIALASHASALKQAESEHARAEQHSHQLETELKTAHEAIQAQAVAKQSVEAELHAMEQQLIEAKEKHKQTLAAQLVATEALTQLEQRYNAKEAAVATLRGQRRVAEEQRATEARMLLEVMELLSACGETASRQCHRDNRLQSAESSATSHLIAAVEDAPIGAIGAIMNDDDEVEQDRRCGRGDESDEVSTEGGLAVSAFVKSLAKKKKKQEQQQNPAAPNVAFPSLKALKSLAVSVKDRVHSLQRQLEAKRLSVQALVAERKRTVETHVALAATHAEVIKKGERARREALTRAEEAKDAAVMEVVARAEVAHAKGLRQLQQELHEALARHAACIAQDLVTCVGGMPDTMHDILAQRLPHGIPGKRGGRDGEHSEESVPLLLQLGEPLAPPEEHIKSACDAIVKEVLGLSGWEELSEVAMIASATTITGLGSSTSVLGTEAGAAGASPSLQSPSSTPLQHWQWPKEQLDELHEVLAAYLRGRLTSSVFAAAPEAGAAAVPSGIPPRSVASDSARCQTRIHRSRDDLECEDDDFAGPEEKKEVVPALVNAVRMWAASLRTGAGDGSSRSANGRATTSAGKKEEREARTGVSVRNDRAHPTTSTIHNGAERDEKLLTEVLAACAAYTLDRVLTLSNTS